MTVGLVSVVAALTLVPALLGLLGDRVNALRVPFLGRAVDSAGTEGRFWSRIARAVMRRPVVSLVASVVVLLAAAAPVLDLRLSQAGLRSFPDEAPSKAGFLALVEEFGVGTVDSALVVVEGDVESRHWKRRSAVSSASSRRTRRSGSPRSGSARIARLLSSKRSSLETAETRWRSTPSSSYGPAPCPTLSANWTRGSS